MGLMPLGSPYERGWGDSTLKRLALLFGLYLVVPALAWASFQDGRQAYKQGDYEVALREWRPLAQQGDARAQSLLGFMYYYGKGVEKDYAKAAKWLGLAAEQGNPGSQWLLGALYYRGEGVPQDYSEAAKWYRLAGEKGNKYAQLGLAFIYDQGKGAPQDYVMAAKWYRRAAEQEIADAQRRLGSMYMQGHGVLQDYTKAANWLRRAAEQGDSKAQGLLGSMYEDGQGVPQDYVEAHKWYNLAAAAGLKIAGEMRNSIARKMTPAQIAEAQRLARSGNVGERLSGWSALTTSDIKAIQRTLKAAGYDSGPADGIVGDRTKAALADYQRHKGLPVGEPGQETLSALGVR